MRSFVLCLLGASVSSASTSRAFQKMRYIGNALGQNAHLTLELMLRRDDVTKMSQSALAMSSSDVDDGDPSKDPSITCSMQQHHTAMKTSNIEMSIAFYSLLDFHPVAKFRSGPARAAWLGHMPNGDASGKGSADSGSRINSAARIELIEIPEEILYEGIDEEERKQMPRKRALDRMTNTAVLGWDHMCLDVTESVRTMSVDGDNDENSTGNLQGWIDALNSKSKSQFGKDLRVALEPRVKLFGKEQYELAFIYDADGALIELVNKLDGSESPVESSWDDEDDSRIIWRNA